MESTTINKTTINLLRKLNDFLSENGLESFVVGGFVRDILLERKTADIDIAVAGDARDAAERIAEYLGGRYVLLDDTNKVARVILFDKKESSSGVSYVLDFSSFTGTITEDLSRRDFTIDAMAIKPGELVADSGDFSLVDPFNGKQDLKKEMIRAVSDTVFSEDAVRLLRAVRLGGELGFVIEPKTEELIKESAELAANVPGERIREELLRLLTVSGAGEILRYLDELGLLTVIFPELEESRGLEQPREHRWDVLEHSLSTVNALECILGESEWEYAGKDIIDSVPTTEEIHEHLDQQISSGSTRKILLKLSALLHDIGKPLTKAVDDDGRMRFLGHSKEGAAIVAERLKKLRFSSREIMVVETAVTHHMRPTQLSQEGMPSNRAVYRYYRDTGPTGIDVLYLNLADHMATRGPELETGNWEEHTGLVKYLIEKYFEKENVVNPPKIVDGYDIIKSFGLSPGPRIGELLDAVREAQASGDVTSREQALKYIEKLIN